MNPMKCDQRELTNFRHIVLNVPTKDTANYHEIFQVDPQHLSQALRLAKSFQGAISPNDLNFNYEKALEIAKDIPNSGVVHTTNHTIIQQFEQLSNIIEQIKESVKTMLGLSVSSPNFWSAVETTITNTFTNLNTQQNEKWISWKNVDSSNTRYYYNILLSIQSAETGGVIAILPISFDISVNVSKEKLLFFTIKDSARYEVKMKGLTLVQILNKENGRCQRVTMPRNVLSDKTATDDLILEVEQAIITGKFDNLLEKIDIAYNDNDPYKGFRLASTIARVVVTVGLYLAPPPLNLAKNVVGFFFKIINSKFNPMETFWNNIIKYMEKMVDQKIETYHIEQIKAHLLGLTSQFKEYQKRISEFNQKKYTDRTLGELICNTLEDIHSAFIRIIPLFEIKEYKLVALPLYVQAAKLHLLILRDADIHGREWGMDEQVISSYKKSLKERINYYTSYAVDVYKSGLENRKKQEIDYNNPEYAPPNPAFKYEYENTIKWNYVNDYINDMTISVLDIVALFPLFDSEHYSKRVQKTNSREFYTKIVGAVYPYDTDRIQIEQKIMSQQPYNGELKVIQCRAWDRIDAISPCFDRGKGLLCTPWIGGSGGALLTAESNYTNPLTKVHVGHQIVPFSFDFKYKDGKELPRMGGKGTPWYAKYSTFEFPGKKLSHTFGFGEKKQAGWYSLDAITFGFHDENLTANHKIELVGITQIPAEVTTENINFIKQLEYSNGQNAIKTGNNNASLTYLVTAFGDGEYQLRYRLSTTGATIRISVNGEAISKSVISDTKDGVPGEYGAYKTVKGPKISLRKNITTEIKLENIAGNFSLDAIEFENISFNLDTILPLYKFNSWLKGYNESVYRIKFNSIPLTSFYEIQKLPHQFIVNGKVVSTDKNILKHKDNSGFSILVDVNGYPINLGDKVKVNILIGNSSITVWETNYEG